MKLITIPVGPIQTNCYIYYDNTSKEAVIIDPGDEAKKIIGKIKGNHLAVQAILLTHGHFDHIGAVNELKNELNVPVISSEEEMVVLKNTSFNKIASNGNISVNVIPDKFISDGEEFPVGKSRLKFLKTPGHTIGSGCFLDEKNRIMFSGDTLFEREIGRCDLPTGSFPTMQKTLKDVIAKLSDSIDVYPGHGRFTNIGDEKKYNPYILEVL